MNATAEKISNELAVSLAKPEKQSLWQIEGALHAAVQEWQEAVQWLAEFDESKLLQDGDADGSVRGNLVANVARAEVALQEYLKAEVRKVDNVAGFLRFAKNMEAAAAAEVKRVRRIQTVWENTQERVKGMVLAVMQAMGEPKFSTPTNTLRRQKNPEALEIFDGLAVPEKFMKVRVTMSKSQWRMLINNAPSTESVVFDLTEFCDEAEVKASLKAGQEVAGARLTQGEHLRVA